MFLFARVFALIIYSSILMIFYIRIKNSDSKKIKRLLILYIILLVIMAYFYVPYKTADLYGIFNYINNSIKHLNIESFLNLAKANRMPMALFYYWIISQTGNLNLLPAFTSLLFYSNVFYIMYKSYTKYEWDSKTLAKVLLFFMVAGQFLEVISGIRCLLGYSIIALCTFKENILEKKILLDLPLYVCAIFLHDSCLVLAFISIIIYIFKSNSKVLLRMFYLFMLVLFSAVLVYRNPEFITSLISHANIYISGIDEYGRETYFYFWEYLIALLNIIFIIYSSLKYNKIAKNSINKSYVYVIISFLIITCIFSFDFSIFERFRTFLMILSIPLFGNAFMAIKKINLDNVTHRSNYNTVFLFLTIIVYTIAVTRGFLCNLKFFE